MKTNMLLLVVMMTSLHPAETIGERTRLNELGASSFTIPSLLPPDSTRLLRLNLYLDAQDYDDIVIGFNDTATARYNYNYDAMYLVGIDAAEGLASFSSDGVALSINTAPLPGKQTEIIRLKVQARNSGTLTLQRTELDALPPIYELWLMDTYKKDSLDLRANSTYAFDVSKADTASFGNNRFRVVVRQNPALGVHLLNFYGAKTQAGAQITWITENEQTYTGFAIERSSDGGNSFTTINQCMSANMGSYSYTDIHPPGTIDRYRLKITDLNGTITYSSEVSLSYGTGTTGLAAAVSAYPNPAAGTINLVVEESTDDPDDVFSYGIKIVNANGRVVETSSSAQGTWQGSIESLLPGMYVVQVTNNRTYAVVGRTTFVKL